jgi:exodeoxyribonuclease VII large subunit
MDEKIFQVSEFNEFVNTYLNQVGEVVVEGEISEIRVNQGKWIFATIKDNEASVDVFSIVFKISGYSILEPGMLVHVYGTPRLYEKTGRFSIFAESIVPAGEGALQIAFEKLKSKLEREGLFDTARKRSLPKFPQNIGLITAKDSRAYSDFVKVLEERMGGIKINFYPISVQGRNSADTIVKAFNYFNKNLSDMDLLVLTRGGGSLEDLQSFNDEKVARAIFSSKIPVVSAVGHEEDISIADHVADVRASTPSNAAELIVRNRHEVIKEVNFCIRSMEMSISKLLEADNQRIFGNITILRSAINKQVYKFHASISEFGTQFTLFSQRTRNLIKESSYLVSSLDKAVQFWLNNEKSALKNTTRLLKSLDVKNILSRGFSITTGENGKSIKSISQVSKKDLVTTLVFDGKISSVVENLSKN